METTDNLTIAHFMGIETTKRNDEYAVFMYTDAAFPEYFRLTQFNTYHQKWGMLMPVLEKIKTIGFDYAICSITVNGKELSEIMISPLIKDGNIEIHTRTEETLIEATYNAVVQFIIWYNLQLNEQ